MTDTELNRRVATLAGWKCKRASNGKLMWSTLGETNYTRFHCPNYTQSRDAIIGLVEGFDFQTRRMVWYRLDEIRDPAGRGLGYTQVDNAMLAPARDICAAYVKVMEGKG